MITLSIFPLLVVYRPISYDNFENAVNVVQFLKDDHFLLPTVNPFRSRVVQIMNLGCLMHGHLRIQPLPLWSLP